MTTKQDYHIAVRILKNERWQRNRVFESNPPRRDAKLAEIDRVLATLKALAIAANVIDASDIQLPTDYLQEDLSKT